MQNTRNITLAITLSLAILIAWHFLYQVPRELQFQEHAQDQQKLQEKLNEVIKENPRLAEKKREIVLNQTAAKRIPINSAFVHGSLSLKGARIDDLTLSKYREELDQDSNKVLLLSPPGTKEVYFAEFGWLSTNTSMDVPNRNTIWNTNDTELTDNTPLNLYWDNQQGVRFIMIIALDPHYMFHIQQKVINSTETAISLAPYGKLQRGEAADNNTPMIVHQGLLGVTDNTLNEVSYSDIRDQRKINYPNSHGWLGFTDKYWLTAMIPDQNYTADITFQHYTLTGKNRYQTDYKLPTITINSQDSIALSHRLFAGAKEVKLLEQYSDQYNIPLFDRSVDFGVLYFLTKPLFGALQYLYNAFGNFGLAILGLTVVIKLLLFPLANKQFRAFAKMRKLAPELTEIRERLKNDRVQMNQEIMTLYKRERVNPMSGCLPALIQIPVFFSLYKVLNITIEMRHAPFYGWIKDLSAPDPTSIFNLFGLLDWNPTGFLLIGVWPIAMATTMYIQYKLNPKANDPIQDKIMKYLPLMFMFILSGFPAGLIIYWTWSNTLSITQQYIITQRTLREDKK